MAVVVPVRVRRRLRLFKERAEVASGGGRHRNRVENAS